MKRLKLTKGKFAIVDNRDFPHVAQYKWQAYMTPQNRTWYALRKFGPPGDRHTISMHRFILGPGKRQVDHRDGNGLNNRRYNLRACSHQKNMRNRRVLSLQKKTSRFKGVSLTRVRTNSWLACIYVSKKRILLGWHPTQEQAALAYNLAAKRHFGEFARLNVL